MDPGFGADSQSTGATLKSTDTESALHKKPEIILDWSWVQDLQIPAVAAQEQAETGSPNPPPAARELFSDLEATPRLLPQEFDGTDPQLRKLTQSLYRRCTVVQPFREDVRQARDLANYELKGYQTKRDFMCQSQVDFMAELDLVMKQLPTALDPETIGRLKERHAALSQDHRDVMEHTTKVRATEIELSQMELDLESLERQLGRAARRVYRHINKTDLLNGDDLTTTAGSDRSHRYPSASNNTVDRVDPLIAEHRKRAAVVKIMQERKARLRDEYTDERTKRNFCEDQEKPVESSDEEFENAHQIDLERATADYDDAARAEAEARQACIRAGLLPATPSTISPNIQPAFEPPSQETDDAQSTSSPSHSLFRLDDSIGDRVGSLPRVLSELVLSDKTVSSTQLSTRATLKTGPLYGNVSPVRRRRIEKAHAKAAIEQWIHSTAPSTDKAYVWEPSELLGGHDDEATASTPKSHTAILRSSGRDADVETSH